MFKKLSLLVAFIAIGVVMMSCTKEGPAGPAGADGKDGNATCGVCHSSSATDVNLKFAQFEYSKHETGVIFEEEGGRTQCDGCHTGTGFAEAAGLKQNDPVTAAAGPINCQACHKIHTKYDMTDFARRQTDPITLRIGGAVVDLKGGNICLKCHQGRTYVMPAGDTSFKSSSSTYSRFGPHYGTPGNVFTMNGPIAIAGSQTVPTTNPHMSLANGCISCHMANDKVNQVAGGHTFEMPIAETKNLTECRTCHDSTRLSTQSIYKQIKTDLQTYRSKLIAKGLLDTTQALSTEGYNVLGEYLAASKTGVAFKKSDLEVAVNYLYLIKDKSNGAHNPSYIKALVANGLEYLNK